MLSLLTNIGAQHVLVGLGRRDEALLVAERGRTRAFVDLLLERQGFVEPNSNSNQLRYDQTPSSVEQLVEIVNRQRACVLYYSLAAGFLYSWFIVPGKGLYSIYILNFYLKVVHTLIYK